MSNLDLFEIENGILKHYKGTDTDVVIPEGVTQLGRRNPNWGGAFYAKTHITSVVIPEGVTRIGETAFYECTNLKKVQLPQSLKVIEEQAFFGCKALEELTLPQGLEKIGKGAFGGCTNLKTDNGFLVFDGVVYAGQGDRETLEIPQGVHTIGAYAFRKMQTLQSVTISDSVVRIEEEAFRGCSALKEIVLPDSVRFLEDSAFFACEALERVRLSEKLETMGIYVFQGCGKLRSISLPAALTAIGDSAFCGCHEELLAITVPQSLTAQLPNEIADPQTLVIAAFCFAGESQIPDSLYWGQENFNENIKLFAIGEGNRGTRRFLFHQDARTLFDKKGNFDWQRYDLLLSNNGPKMKFSPALRSLAMLYRLRDPQDLPQPLKAAFTEFVCKNVKKLAPYVNLLPQDGLVQLLEEIGAIHDKNRKTLLTLMGLAPADTAKKAAKGTADGTKTAAQLKKEWTTQKLEDGTLRLSAYKGEDVDILVPSKIGNTPVTVLGEYCLSPNSWTASDKQSEHRSKIRSVVIPEGIVCLENSVFAMCDHLEKISLPQSLKEIGAVCFRRCRKLKEVTLPEDVKLGENVFWECDALADEQGFVIQQETLFDYIGTQTQIAVPQGVKHICSGAFQTREKLQAVQIPEGVKKLPEGLFEHQDSLHRIFIPASVDVIEEICRWKTHLQIHGYTGSFAQKYAQQKGWQFVSKGVVEQDISDFVISDGVLQEYRGKEETVQIPQTVHTIGCFSVGWRSPCGPFEGNRKIKKVMIPEGVTCIGNRAFHGCTALEEISIPHTVNRVGKGAFADTLWLRNQGAGEVYAGSVLYACKDGKAEVALRPGTTAIAQNAFLDNETVTKLILPPGLQYIGSVPYSYFGRNRLRELVVPVSVEELGDDFTECLRNVKITGDVLRRTEKMPTGFKAFYHGDPEDSAWIVLYQGEKPWQNAITKNLTENPQNVSPVMEKLAERIQGLDTLSKPEGNRAAAFALQWCGYAQPGAVQALYEALKNQNHPAVKKLEENQEFRNAAAGPQEEDLSDAHPVEAMVAQALTRSPLYDKVLKQIYTGVRYADSEEVCAPRVLAYIVSEYVGQYNENHRYLTGYDVPQNPILFREIADRAAQALDRQLLLDMLKQLAELNDKEYWTVYARYADEAQTAALVRQIREWDNYSKYGPTGRKNIFFARNGLYLNDTKAAMEHMDRTKSLERYAQLRGTDADTLRDTVLVELGFDDHWEIRYDLGGNTAVVRINKDLTLSIFDTNAGKPVKSIPKKGADPQLYEQAKTAFSELKKNMRRVAANRKKILFADFLSGAERTAEVWKRIYLENPVLNSVAKLIVWSQKGKTFTLTPDGMVDSSGKAYTLTNDPICVAHPMEMRSEIAAWQNFFLSNGLKQPFEQIWEPAYLPDQILRERYCGCKLNVYRFANKEEHGITLWGLRDYSESYGFDLKDCKIEQTASEWRFIHGVTDDATFELGKFTFEKYTRQVNHIVYLLDKWTVSERIVKDDASVAELLSGFTAAQIRAFVALALESGSTNCTALLLEYQNQHFGGFDPMEEFTLDL